jgi:acyl-coenzyme A thioesterase PaaI-like protein
MNLMSAYRTLDRVPVVGRRAFSVAYQFAAPYFLTIPVRMIDVEPGIARARMAQTPWVRNHLGTVHAIALCNLAEYTMGAVAEATIPATHRWVPKGMTVSYDAKARGTMHATATLALPSPLESRAELPVTITVRDDDDMQVFTAEIRIWVTEKPARAG